MTSQPETNQEISQLASEVQTRIAALEGLFEDSLVGEMEALKTVLKANPSAAALMRDEDIGLLVAALRRTVQADIEEATTEKKPGRKPKQKTTFTKEELDAALAEEGLL